MSPISLYTLLALTGLAVGSFLNVIVDRLPQGESLLKPRSYCPNCLRPVIALDMVPVLNYLWLRGRCRHCKAPIPWRLPLVEALTGAFFLLAGVQWESSALTAIAVTYIAVLIIIFFVDLERGLILNGVVYPAILLALVLAPSGFPGQSASTWWQAYLFALGGGALAFSVMLAIYLASRGGMGEGDVKMAAFMGAALGVRLVMVALPLSFVAGGLVAVLLLVFKLRGRKEPVPFGPFLAAGTLAAMFWGENILSWYRDLVGFF